MDAVSKQKKKRKDIQKLILRTVAIAGVVGVGLLAPNVLGAMAKIGLRPNKRQKEFIATSRTKLVKRGFLEYKDGKLRLTSTGEAKLRRLRLLEYRLKKPKQWDGKWRVLIFDIPENRKSLRNKIRETLVALGFVRLQDSVWIYPYDCEDILTLLKADFRVGKDMLYMVVESLEFDGSLRSHFKLHR